jgi:DNA polymerase-3 subunit delta'
VIFDSVVGHDRIKRLLARALTSGRLPPALLFSGPEGIGKKRLALVLGRALLCEREGKGPCDACGACRRGLRGMHPDLILLEPATAVIKVDQVRELVDQISGLPFEGRARTVIIDNAHLLTEEAANALLKSLEEPPPTSHAALITASPQALLPTIRSRCQELRMGPLPLSLLEDRLAEQLPREEARLRAALSGGSLGAALAFESDGYRSLREELLGLLERLPNGGVTERLLAAERLADVEDHGLALTALRGLLRDVAALRVGAAAEGLLNQDVGRRLVAIAAGPLGERAAGLASFAGEIRAALAENANHLLSMDILMDALAG